MSPRKVLELLNSFGSGGIAGGNMKNHTADNFLKTNNYFVCASPLLAPFTQITDYQKRSKR